MRTVLGGGTVAAASALFAARYGPVRLCAGRIRPPAHAVESVPAATLTLLLELGVTPDELDVPHLTRSRSLAWDDPAPQRRDGPATAHLDRAALHAALWRRVRAEPRIGVAGRADTAQAGPGWVDATGRRAVTARDRIRPPRTWTAATVTVRSDGTDGELRCAAAPDGYAYRLASAGWTTVGWSGPDAPPRTGASLRGRVGRPETAWLLDGVEIPPDAATDRRPCGVSVPVHAGAAVPVGDAALTRDALASQGVSIGLSDACLAATPGTTAAAMTARRDEARQRHLRHLAGMVAACRFADAPVWAELLAWLRRELATARPCTT